MFEPLLNLETSANGLGTLQGKDKYYNKGGCQPQETKATEGSES